MISVETLAGFSILLSAIILFLIVHARATSVSLSRLQNAVEMIADELDAMPAVEAEKTLSGRLTAAELSIDKLRDAYNRLRGTVARLHRSDVRDEPEERATVSAPSDETTRLAYKEKLRDAARQRGILK